MGGRLFDLMNLYLSENNLFVSEGTIVDAKIVNAPSSTKDREKQRDPEMYQTHKGNQWYWCMKVHDGMVRQSQLILSVAVTPDSVRDFRVLNDLLYGEETVVWGGSAYSGQGEEIHRLATGALDTTNRKGGRHRKFSARDRDKNRTRYRVRSKVEHILQIMKCQLGVRKVRYKGLMKNANHTFTYCAL